MVVSMIEDAPQLSKPERTFVAELAPRLKLLNIGERQRLGEMLENLYLDTLLKQGLNGGEPDLDKDEPVPDSVYDALDAGELIELTDFHDMIGTVELRWRASVIVVIQSLVRQYPVAWAGRNSARADDVRAFGDGWNNTSERARKLFAASIALIPASVCAFFVAAPLPDDAQHAVVIASWVAMIVGFVGTLSLRHVISAAGRLPQPVGLPIEFVATIQDHVRGLTKVELDALRDALRADPARAFVARRTTELDATLSRIVEMSPSTDKELLAVVEASDAESRPRLVAAILAIVELEEKGEPEEGGPRRGIGSRLRAETPGTRHRIALGTGLILLAILAILVGIFFVTGFGLYRHQGDLRSMYYVGAYEMLLIGAALRTRSNNAGLQRLRPIANDLDAP
jgi:hypothetical protein